MYTLIETERYCSLILFHVEMTALLDMAEAVRTVCCLVYSDPCFPSLNTGR